MSAKSMAAMTAGLALALAACGSSGLQTIQDKTNGFSLSTPSDWTQYPVNKDTLAKIESQLKSNAKLAPIAAELKGPAAQYIKLLVVNTTSHQDATVLVIPIPSGVPVSAASLGQLEQGVVGSLQQVGAQTTPGPVTTINGHPAFKVAVSYNTKIHGQSLPAQTQYYFLVGRSVYNLDLAGTDRTETSQILQSFKISGTHST